VEAASCRLFPDLSSEDLEIKENKRLEDASTLADSIRQRLMGNTLQM
jgi:hypothetical protein